MVEPVPFKYRAFISYSHADTPWAKWLHRALESFPIDKDLVGRETSNGPIPNSLRPIFRDRDDFTAGHSLNEQTLAALDASAALVVICSPAAATSHYVNEEIRLFKSRYPERPVVPLIVGGKPGDAALECFPPALKFTLDADGQITDEPVELLAADAREEGDGKSLALAKVIAGMLGVSSDDVFRRAERERRRKGRVRNSVIAVLAVLAVAATGSAAYAWQQLKTNEAFLTATLKTATEIVDTAVSQAEKFGVPRSATLALLTKAEGLFDNMALLGRPTPELRYDKALMLIAFARNYQALGDIKKWDERAEEARQLFAELTKEQPEDMRNWIGMAAAQDELSRLAEAAGDLEGALAGYRSSIAITQVLAKADPDEVAWQHDLSVFYNRIGAVLMQQGDIQGALQSYRDALAIRTRIAERNPDDEDAQYDLGLSDERIGDVLMAKGDYEGALDPYDKKQAIMSRLAESDPNNTNWQVGLAVAYEKVGNVLLALGALDGALESFKTDLDISQRLATADPSNASWQRDLSTSYIKVGDVLFQQGNTAGALNSYRASLAIRTKLAAGDPDNAQWQRDLCSAYQRVGDGLKAQGNAAEALDAYRSSYVLIDGLAKADPSNAIWQRDLAVANSKIGRTLAEQGDTKGALERLRVARAIIARLVQQSPEDTQLALDLAGTDGVIETLAPGASPAAQQDQPAR